MSFSWTVSHNVSGYSDRLFLSKAYDEMLVEYSKTPQDEMAAFLDKKRKHVEEVMKVRC
jgi:hypothetical protein